MLSLYIFFLVFTTYTVNADYGQFYNGYPQSYDSPPPPLPYNNGWNNNYWSNFQSLWTPPAPYYPLQNNELNYNSYDNGSNYYSNGKNNSASTQGLNVTFNDEDGLTNNGKKIPVDELGNPLNPADANGISGDFQPYRTQNNRFNSNSNIGNNFNNYNSGINEFSNYNSGINEFSNYNSGYNGLNHYNNGNYGYDMYPQTYWNPPSQMPANEWTNWPNQGASVVVQNGVLMINGKIIPEFVKNQGAVIKYGRGILTINGERIKEFDGITGTGTINIGPNSISTSNIISDNYYDYDSDYNYDENSWTDQSFTQPDYMGNQGLNVNTNQYGNTYNDQQYPGSILGGILQTGSISMGKDGIKIGGPNGLEMGPNGIKNGVLSMGNDGIKIGGPNGIEMGPNGIKIGNQNW